MSERDWLTERRKERRAVAEAVVTAKESEEQPKPDAQVSEPEQEPTAETSHEEPAEGSERVDAQTEDATEATTEGEEGYFPETLTEFAEAVGADPSDFMQGVTAQVKVNGETQSVPLNDLLEAYSSKAERDRLGTALAEERNAFEASTQQHEQQYQERLRQADEYLHAMRAAIDLGPDDQKLAEMLSAGQIDERGYITAKTERDAKITAFNGAVQQRNAFVQQQHEEQQTKLEQHRKQQQDALMAWKPELRDSAKLSEFETQLRNGLKDPHYGFSDDEVSEFFGNFNLRQLKIVEDALAFRQLKAQEQPIKQRLGQLPRLQKPGPKRSAGQAANDKILGARNRLRTSQSTEAGVAFIRERRLARRNLNRDGSQ